MLFNSMSAGDTLEFVRSVAPDASWCLASLVMSRNYGAGCSRLVIRCSGMIDGSIAAPCAGWVPVGGFEGIFALAAAHTRVFGGSRRPYAHGCARHLRPRAVQALIHCIFFTPKLHTRGMLTGSRRRHRDGKRRSFAHVARMPTYCKLQHATADRVSLKSVPRDCRLACCRPLNRIHTDP